METVSSFVETEKTDIRYVISYFGQSRFFEVLPLFVGSVKKFVSLEENDSFLVRITI